MDFLAGSPLIPYSPVYPKADDHQKKKEGNLSPLPIEEELFGQHIYTVVPKAADNQDPKNFVTSEYILKQIFDYLRTLPDQMNLYKSEPVPAAQEKSEKNVVKYKFRHHQQIETPFKDQWQFKQSENSNKLFERFFTIMKAIFIGEKNKSDISTRLNACSYGWRDACSQYYTKNYHKKVHDAFLRASLLFKEKESYSKLSYYQRISLYASLIISTVGKLLNSSAMTFCGLASASLIFLSMIAHYAISQFKLDQESSLLKQSVEIAEKGSKSPLSRIKA